jgi:hypothetical protein
METVALRRFQVGDLVRFRRGAGVRLNYDVAPNEVGTVSGIESRSPATSPSYRVEVSFKNALVFYTFENGFEPVHVDSDAVRAGWGRHQCR